MYLLLVFLSFISLQAAQKNDIYLLKQVIEKSDIEEAKKILEQNPSLAEEEGFYILHAAVKTKSLNLVQYILDKKLVDVNTQDSMGYTALHMAVESNQKEIVELLLNRGANPNLRTIFEGTALHAAVCGNFSEIVQLLINKNAEIDAQGSTGSTALYYAASKGFSEIVKILLEHNANPWIAKSSPDKNILLFFDTPLYQAISNGYSEIVELFITKSKYPIDVNGLYQMSRDFKATLLHVAAMKGEAKVMEVLVKSGADLRVVDSQGQSALHQAACYQKAEAVRFLIKEGIDKDMGDEKGNTPLHVAVEEWNREIVLLFLKAGVDCNKRNKALKKAEEMAIGEKIKNILVSTGELFEAIENGEGTGKIKNLLRAGAYMYAKNSEGKTAEVLARDMGKTEIENVLRETREFVETLQTEKRILEKYLKGEVVVDVFNEDGVTPLQWAAQNGCVDIFQNLLNFGAELDDETVHFFAVGKIAIEKIISQKIEDKIVCQAGIEVIPIDVNTLGEGNEDRTILLPLPAMESGGNIAKDLVKPSANLQTVGRKRRPALRRGAYSKEEVMQFLIKQGIDKDMCDEEGNTPLHVAAEEWGREIVLLLLKAGVDYNKKNKDLKKAEEIARDEEIKNILVSTRELFETIEKGEGAGKIKNLLRAGAYIYAKNSQGKTAEVLARDMGKTEIENVLRQTREFIRALQAEKRILEKYLKGEAVVDAFNEEGITPLQWAAQNGCVDVFRDLLNFGAELDDGTVNFFAAGNIAIEKIINQKIKNGKISRNMIGVTAFLSLATIGCAWHEFRQVQKKDQAVPCKKTFFQKLFDGVKRKKKTAVCLALTLLSGGGSWYFAHRKV